MIAPHDYAIEINADDMGVWVRVRHKITGAQREARLSATESVGAVRDRLIAQIAAEIYDLKDIVIEVGHTRKNGIARDYIRVTHKPSGINRGARHNGEVSHRDLLDEVLTELWQRRSEADS